MDKGGTTGVGLTLNTSGSFFVPSTLDHRGGGLGRHRSMGSDLNHLCSSSGGSEFTDMTRVAVNEMDFFSEERKKAVSKVENDLDLMLPSSCVKKEDLTIHVSIYYWYHVCLSVQIRASKYVFLSKLVDRIKPSHGQRRQ